MNTKFWLGNLNERNQMEDPDIDERTILQWTFTINGI
jgi:hypothetical protein